MDTKNQLQQDKLLPDFISFISENYIFDWEYDLSFGNKILSSLSNSANKLEYFFHLKRGDVLCFMTGNDVLDLSLSPIVWLGAEGIPHNVTATNFVEFLQLSYLGSGLLYDINSICFDYKYDQHSADPEIIYNDDRVKYAVENFSIHEENYSLLIEWLESKGIDKMQNPVSYIKQMVLSIPFE